MDRTIPSPRKRQRLSSATTASTTTRKTSTSLARSKGPCSSLRTADSTSGPQRSGSSIDGKDRESSSATLDADADAMAILRAHFESRFEPIAANTASSADESHDHDGQTAEYDDDEWEGCSSDNASSEDEQDGEEKRREPVVVVVHHQETTAGHGHLSNLAHEGDGDVDVRISKAEMRAFLVSSHFYLISLFLLWFRYLQKKSKTRRYDLG